MDELFTITEIQPIGHGLWLAEVMFRHPETINGTEVAQIARLRVRFSCADDEPISALMDHAYRKARECVESTAAVIARATSQQMIADWRRQMAFDPAAEFDGPQTAN